MVLPAHIVVSDKIAPIGTLSAVEHGAARGTERSRALARLTRERPQAWAS
jgi:hypothetical protein